MLGCITQRVSRSVAPCPLPPPPPPCSPTQFDAVTVDTHAVANGTQWQLVRVEGANTPVHEWALLPYADADMLLSGRNAAVSRYDVVKRVETDRIELKTLSSFPPEHYITVVASDAITGDASIAKAQYNTATNSIDAVIDEQASPLSVGFSWDGHPTVSKNGRFVVFASDRKSSMGGTDLWYAVRQGTGWTTPQLLSGGVNTPCDELSPFFTSNDSTLLFSSAGHSAVGGYDMFEVDVTINGNELRTGSPRNIGKPLNSEFDELFPRSAENGTFYFSSDRPKENSTDRKDFDVFVLQRVKRTTPLPPPPPPAKKVKPTTVVTGTVVDQQTQLPVPDANVTARDILNNEVVGQTRTDTAGEYAINVPVETQLEISAQAPDLFFDEVRVILPEYAANDTFNIEKPLALPEVFVLRVNFPTAIFDAPYQHTLDSNGVETWQNWEEALDLLARNVKVSGARLIKLLLIGHTDDVDDDSSNMVLGKNRVNFVMDELVKRGVRRELLEGRSAGESMLLSRRSSESVDLWRKRSRRVELVKVMHK